MSAKENPKKHSTIKQKLEDLDELVRWFEEDEFDIEQALEKFEQAKQLSQAIEEELKKAKNKIDLVKQKFDV